MNDHPKTVADDLRSVLFARLELLDEARRVAEARCEERIKTAKEHFHLEMQALEEQRDAITRLLTIEERRLGGPIQMPGANRPPVHPLGDFLVRFAKVNGPKSKAEFLAAAMQAGYDLDGRSIHAALVNSMRTHRLELREDGRYGIPASEPVELALEEKETPF